MSISPDQTDPPGHSDDGLFFNRDNKRGNKALKDYLGAHGKPRGKIEIRDAFNQEGVLIYFSFEAVLEIIGERPETIGLLAEKLVKCKEWNQYVKRQRTRRIFEQATQLRRTTRK